MSEGAKKQCSEGATHRCNVASQRCSDDKGAMWRRGCRDIDGKRLPSVFHVKQIL